ncbi:MAG: hypothetical protein FWF51_12970 [Chitinivibrionia bacterium]|nr:hypothetical protein [Chitinivibrionia bacterium]
MKKLDFFKYVAVFAAFCLLFVAGCGDDDDNKGTDPSIPKGDLSNHDGDNAPITTQEDLEAFFAAWDEEKKAGRDVDGTRCCGDSGRIYNGLVGGGNRIAKDLSYSEEGSGDDYKYSLVYTSEYNNYSNKGVLYLGGGTKTDRDGGGNANAWSKYTHNGTIRFNGTFNGTIEFKDFKYSLEYSPSSSDRSYKYESGIIKIGSIEIGKSREDIAKLREINLL